jgi:hypothetical protein
MPAYFPLILNTGAGQIQELAALSDLDLTSSNISAVSNITASGTVSVNSGNAATAIANGGTNGTGNIGSSTTGFNTVFAKSTSAQYADLAEKYLADQDYAVGTVVSIGGSKEITACQSGDRAIGAVSEKPAFMMNSHLDGGTYVALKGRVPVKVLGPVNKGDRLVAGSQGTAVKAVAGQEHNTFAIVIETNTDPNVKSVEAIIL